MFLHGLRKKVERDTALYTDRALIPVELEEGNLPRAPAKKPAAVAA
jgi:hypothetical protein